MTTDTTITDPAKLRAALTDHIRQRHTFRTPQVEKAFRAVPRHLFLSGMDVQTAYAPQVVVTKRADDGTAISSASHPNLVAAMLEQLAVQPGHRVLEIGAATGINAALLAELAAPTGKVVTIEIDDDLAAGARAGLTAAGYHHVEVICADGAGGHPARAPYDRIIVTAGAWDLVLHLDANGPADEAALGQALTYPAHEHWTGMEIDDGEPVEHLDLWLATVTSRFARLSVGADARESGLVTPALRWAGAALYGGGTIAYIAVRPLGGESAELGVIAHGPESSKFAAQTVGLLARWNRERPSQPVITAQPAATPDGQRPHGHHVDRPDTRLTITW